MNDSPRAPTADIGSRQTHHFVLAVVQNNVKVSLKEGPTVNAAQTVNIAKNGIVYVDLVANTPVLSAARIDLEGGTGVQQSYITVKMNPTCQYSADIDPAYVPPPVAR